jgi:hypothetical protein
VKDTYSLPFSVITTGLYNSIRVNIHTGFSSARQPQRFWAFSSPELVACNMDSIGPLLQVLLFGLNDCLGRWIFFPEK